MLRCPGLNDPAQLPYPAVIRRVPVDEEGSIDLRVFPGQISEKMQAVVPGVGLPLGDEPQLFVSGKPPGQQARAPSQQIAQGVSPVDQGALDPLQSLNRRFIDALYAIMSSRKRI